MRAKKVKMLRKVAKQAIENSGKAGTPYGIEVLYNNLKNSYKSWRSDATKTERAKVLIGGR